MSNWKDLVSVKQEEQKNAIPPDWRLPCSLTTDTRPTRLIAENIVQNCTILTVQEMHITGNLTAAELLDHMAQRRLKAVDVAVAFCKRAAVAQQLSHCLTEIFFDDAIQRAQWLDQYMEEHGEVCGPLHGLPISLKDTFKIKGKHATSGYVELLKEIPDSNSGLVDLLLNAGAVLYVKTNIPQTLMTADSHNHIFSRTLNPHNTKLTAGGSSGGEGALLALHGSPLGVGTDAAWSIRIPAACCGIYGFKPTAGRVPFVNQSPPRKYSPGITAVAGPMGVCVADLELFMRVVSNQVPWRYDGDALPIPWADVYDRYSSTATTTKQSSICISVLPEDPAYPIHPPIRRAINQAVEILEKAGHRVVRLPTDPTREVNLGTRIAWQYAGLGGLPGADLLRKSGEPLIPSVCARVHPYTVDGPVCEESSCSSPLDLIAALHTAQGQYNNAWRKTWLDFGLDVVLAPAAQCTAVRHDTFGLPPYTFMWNVIDYPACSLPFGRASKDLDPEPTDYRVAFQPEYDPEEMDGVPCAIQIIAPRHQDELCLYAAGVIDADLKRG